MAATSRLHRRLLSTSLRRPSPMCTFQVSPQDTLLNVSIHLPPFLKGTVPPWPSHHTHLFSPNLPGYSSVCPPPSVHHHSDSSRLSPGPLLSFSSHSVQMLWFRTSITHLTFLQGCLLARVHLYLTPWLCPLPSLMCNITYSMELLPVAHGSLSQHLLSVTSLSSSPASFQTRSPWSPSSTFSDRP